MKEEFCAILTDVTLRFLRCAGETRLSSNWRDRWPQYAMKHAFMWEVRWHHTGLGYYEKHQSLRIPGWLERRNRA